MIKLYDLLLEGDSLYQVKAQILIDSQINVTDVLNWIRAIRKVTIVHNETTPEMDQHNKRRNDGKELHKISVKYMSASPKEDLEFLKKTMMRSKEGDLNPKVPGLLNIKFKPETIITQKY